MNKRPALVRCILLLSLLPAAAACTDDESAVTITTDADGSTADATIAVGDVRGNVPDAFVTLSRDGAASYDSGTKIEDGGAPTALKRLVFFTSLHGILHDELVMRWPGAADEVNWQRSLATDRPPWSATLAPLSAFNDQMVVVEGLALHATLAGMAQPPPRPPGAYYFDRDTGAFTGDVMATPEKAFGPSIDFLVSSRHPVARGTSLQIAGSSMLRGTSYDDTGKMITYTPRGAVKPADFYQRVFGGTGCSAQPPGAWEGISDFMTVMTPLVLSSFNCDLARVIQLQLPEPSPEKETNGRFVAMDCLAVETSPEIHKCFADYQVLLAKQLAKLVSALAATPEGNGTMLDNTLVVWLSNETPAHEFSPWDVVMIGGKNLGFTQSRYLHYAQNVSGASPSKPAQKMGPPHNLFLVTLAHWFGVDVQTIGKSKIKLASGQILDATGTLPGL